MSFGHREVSLRAPLTPTVRGLMIALGAVYLASIAAVMLGFGDVMVRNLWLYPEALPTGRVWTVATYAWFHELSADPLISLVVCGAAVGLIVWLYNTPFARREFFLFLIGAFLILSLVGRSPYGAPMHLAGNLLGLYFFGHVFENRWGPRRFLVFWAITTIAGGLLTAGVWWLYAPERMPVVIGASAGVMGLVAAYSVTFPEQQVLYGMVVPIKGKYFLLVAIAFDVVSFLSGQPIAFFAHIGGVLAAVILCTGLWRPTKLRDVLSGARPKKRPGPRKSHLRVIRGDRDEEPPRYLH